MFELLRIKNFSTFIPVFFSPVHSCVLCIVRTTLQPLSSVGNILKNEYTARSGISVWLCITAGRYFRNRKINHSGKVTAARRSNR